MGDLLGRAAGASSARPRRSRAGGLGDCLQHSWRDPFVPVDTAQETGFHSSPMMLLPESLQEGRLMLSLVVCRSCSYGGVSVPVVVFTCMVLTHPVGHPEFAFTQILFTPSAPKLRRDFKLPQRVYLYVLEHGSAKFILITAAAVLVTPKAGFLNALNKFADKPANPK